MFIDVKLQIAILKYNKADEKEAFRWLFTPISFFNHRTPMEVISDGGRDRVMGYLVVMIEKKEKE